MTMIIPVEQFGSDYTFSTPASHGSEYSFTHYLMIVTEHSKRGGIMVNGTAESTSGWTTIPGTDPQLSAKSMSVSEGVHRVRHTSPNATFGGYLYGYGTGMSGYWTGKNIMSYALPVGMRMVSIFEVCIRPIFGTITPQR